jgi:hypothetical protein
MDERGEVAFLETDKLDSVRFYARCGFEVSDQGEVLGTPNWWMRRPVQKPAADTSGVLTLIEQTRLGTKVPESRSAVMHPSERIWRERGLLSAVLAGDAVPLRVLSHG